MGEYAWLQSFSLLFGQMYDVSSLKMFKVSWNLKLGGSSSLIIEQQRVMNNEQVIENF